MTAEGLRKTRREKYCGASDLKRIEVIGRDIWISCPRHQSITKTVDNILKLKDVEPAPCMLVCGEGGFGKTALINELKMSSKDRSEAIRFMSLADNPGMLKFSDLVMSALGVPILPGRATTRALLPPDIVKYVRQSNIRALIIDEMQSSLTVSRGEQERNLLLIKALSGAPYRLSIIAFGTSAAKNALSVDAQLSRRYEILELQRWTLDDEFRNFLASWENELPLREDSRLYRDDIAKALLLHSNGVMDFVVKGVKWAAIQAVLTGEEKITKELIEKGFATRWSY